MPRSVHAGIGLGSVNSAPSTPSGSLIQLSQGGCRERNAKSLYYIHLISPTFSLFGLAQVFLAKSPDQGMQNMDYVSLAVTGHPQLADYYHTALDDVRAGSCIALPMVLYE
jgi:hypothetical protein